MDKFLQTPLVSIVIPTWDRHVLLEETLHHILQQTFEDYEIIVISDGVDDELRRKCGWFFAERGNEFKHELSFIDLGRNWSGLSPENFGIAPLLVGYLSARGKYIMPWCDDERAIINKHIQIMVNEIEKGYDFVYPRVHIWRNGDPNGPETAIIGTVPPVHGQITHYMFRYDALTKYGFPEWGTHPVDWSLVNQWIQKGATYSMINLVTFSHRLDQ